MLNAANRYSVPKKTSPYALRSNFEPNLQKHIAEMLEYFAYKKVKQHKADKLAKQTLLEPTPVLSDEDAQYLARIAEEGTPPPLPTRPSAMNLPEAGDATANAAQLVPLPPTTPSENEITSSTANTNKADKGKGKATESTGIQKAGRLAFITSRFGKRDGLEPTNKVVPPSEVEKEEDDINKILEELNLSAVNNRAFSLSKESQVLVQKFTVILKDLMNGVPTAYDDLVGLLEDSQGTLSKSYDSLPSFLQKLITTLPQKLTSTLAPELLAVAAEAQKLSGASTSAAGAGFGATVKNMLTPSSLKDLVTKPGAVAGLLKAIMNALKLRWPAFMGTNVLLSLGLFGELFRTKVFGVIILTTM